MRHLGFFIIALSLFWVTGCKQDGGTASPSADTRLENTSNKTIVEVTIGGKVWKIDPTQSYSATGVWTNPNPRPLTEAEKKRLEALPALIQEAGKHLDELDKELRYLERIEETEIKTHYNFGKRPHFSPGERPKFIDLGEFPIEMEMPEKTHTQPSEHP